MILDSMKDELSAWNDGTGIDLESWIGCVGNFNLAVGYSSIFWPSFQELKGYILTAHANLANVETWEASQGMTPKSLEKVINHLHIADIQHSACEDIAKDKIVFLGETLKEIYQAKLAWQFPEKPCVVEFYHSENDDLIDYQLTFWQQKHEQA